MKEPLHVVAAAIMFHALVQILLGVIGLQVAKSFEGFGKQLAQFGRSLRSVAPTEVAPKPPEPDPALTTADAFKSEALRQFELELQATKEGKGP